MPDKQAAMQLHAEVTVTEDDEVRYWMDTLGVTEEALRRAVADAGTRPCDVRDYLGAPPGNAM
ncbi:DUF3606 domain-containing protein [Variovorax sp. Sphag1AA]|uniref:DUF3606 domain-containing protein n=1 Tax=Variovorax sp. Sphag1AA TaxID=2587027 RepID=UPI00160A1CB8|nr:DUF3606 domain-containing protein [Variovorax sp. Sphag1AA]MBB3178703.1 hypothetical protein [Variovorax sp. Sphag1AA]